jgi:hypothetical protein
MTYVKIIIFGMVMFFFCQGCGLNETVVQKEKKSYLTFIGNLEGSVVYIDNLDPITLIQQKINYEISPGKHRIVVKKDSKEVVNRELLLGNGIVKEIEIP